MLFNYKLFTFYIIDRTLYYFKIVYRKAILSLNFIRDTKRGIRSDEVEN